MLQVFELQLYHRHAPIGEFKDIEKGSFVLLGKYLFGFVLLVQSRNLSQRFSQKLAATECGRLRKGTPRRMRLYPVRAMSRSRSPEKA
jgi:hypothetical protein